MTQKQKTDIIKSESDETDSDEGYWLFLKDGWTVDECSAIHEATREQAKARLCEARYKKP
jgi:hypothetical protein